ncbi:hypothetical protein [Phaeodactylibacter xiamenensis]|jgi:hypothetical protein|uniref:Uncharacterized protein n=1 Tax=Phaeodactylibacter xiamenensis TaxID=1524460 RepID=A0A098S9W6_9BACT|nr:hypothetical protein [Phaeodactylibacter xiamenensis]KGE88916.1 hypothetical protein IX84_05870 [Phaeodactylibacter xiamenensis]MCR9052670.1 hypothetical protein [bacterium]
MKGSIFFVVLVVFWGCCQDDDLQPMPGKVDCSEVDCMIEDEFYGSGLLNRECWTTSFVGISPLSEDDLIIIFGDPDINGIRGELRFVLEKSRINLQDTIWLGKRSSSSDPTNFASARYIYLEGNTPVGGFDFMLDAPFTFLDFLLIDGYNADTSLIYGQFQLRFPESNVSSFVTHAPDSMNIKCGSFKVEKF